MYDRAMKTVVYTLKRQFGVDAKIIIPDRTVDRRTGQVSTVEEIRELRIIALPAKFSWDSAGVTRGGITRVDAGYQKGDREFLVESDWESHYQIQLNNGAGDPMGAQVFSTVDFTKFSVATYVIGRIDAV